MSDPTPEQQAAMRGYANRQAVKKSLEASELDAETKARIEAEEAYRAQVRAQQGQTPPPKSRKMGCGGFLVVLIALFLLIGFVVQLAGEPSSTVSNSSVAPTSSEPVTADTAPAPEPSPVQPDSTAPESIEKAASGKINTEPFTLQGGNYTINAFAENDCVYYLKLVKTTEQDFEGKDLASFTEAGNQESNIYNIEPGDYYIAANTGPSPECAWEVNISR